ncbi:MAG: anti-sigma factor antagonist [Kutzneria sp.]|nr:anti-sigma factor antagonist [Kutzneria sp.]
MTEFTDHSVFRGVVSRLLNVTYEIEGRAVVVHAAGEVDLSIAPLLADQLRTAETAAIAPAPVVLNLGDVTFFGSPGLSVLVEHHYLCAALGTPLRVVAGHRPVTRPLAITGLDQMITTVPTMRHALDAE